MFESLDLEMAQKELHLLAEKIRKINIYLKKYGIYPNDKPFITIDIADNIEIMKLHMEIQKIFDKCKLGAAVNYLNETVCLLMGS